MSLRKFKQRQWTHFIALDLFFAQRLFHIIDLDGQREKSFHKVVAARFRIFKSRLVGRWIKFTIKPPKNSAHLMPWQVYKGFITEEQWEKFKSSRLQPDAEVL